MYAIHYIIFENFCRPCKNDGDVVFRHLQRYFEYPLPFIRKIRTYSSVYKGIAWKTNTQEKIAEDFKLTQPGVKKIIETFITNGKIAESYKNFTPLLYNIWNTQEQIAEKVGVSQQAINKILQLIEKFQLVVQSYETDEEKEAVSF